LTEEEFSLCMQQMAAGDRNALQRVYQVYLNFIFSVCMSRLRHRESAEDVTSEFFIRLYQNAGRFRSGSGHKRWMATIAGNLCIDYMRKNGREMAVLDAPDEEGNVRELEDSSGSETGSGFEQHVENRLTLEKAMQVLTKEQQEILSLKVQGGLKFREIAEMLGMPQGTVSWHYNEALKKLRRVLS